MITFRTTEALFRQVGQDLGVSEWHRVDQSMIDLFADLTGDRQWIHRTEHAHQSPFGLPIAHGLLTLALLIPMLGEIFQVEGADMVVNKGLDTVRFIRPVPAGAEIRAAAVLRSAQVRPRDFTEVVVRSRIIVAGRSEPAFRADCVLLYHLGKEVEPHITDADLTKADSRPKSAGHDDRTGVE